MYRDLWSLRSSLALYLLLAGPLLAQKPTYRVELTTKLGATIVAPLEGNINSLIAGATDFFENTNSFVLDLGKNAYLEILFQTFRRATLNKDIHSIELSNGAVVSGHLVGVIGFENRTYDLRSAESIRVLGESSPEKAATHKKVWNLASSLPSVVAIADPLLTYRYNGSDFEFRGDITLIRSRAKPTAGTNFVIKIGEEKLDGDLRDFSAVSVRYDLKGSQVTVKAPNGRESQGQLLLPAVTPDTSEWGIIGYVPEWADSRLLLLKSNFTLTSK